MVAVAPSDSDCTNICSPAMAALSPLRQELVDNRKKQSTLDSFWPRRISDGGIPVTQIRRILGRFLPEVRFDTSLSFSAINGEGLSGIVSIIFGVSLLLLFGATCGCKTSL